MMLAICSVELDDYGGSLSPNADESIAGLYRLTIDLDEPRYVAIYHWPGSEVDPPEYRMHLDPWEPDPQLSFRCPQFALGQAIGELLLLWDEAGSE